MITTYQQSVFKRCHSDKYLSVFTYKMAANEITSLSPYEYWNELYLKFVRAAEWRDVWPWAVAISDRCAATRRLSARHVVQVSHDDPSTFVEQQEVRLLEVGNAQRTKRRPV